MIKLKGLLTEELTQYPNSNKIEKLLRGYKKYSHGPNEVGFVGTGVLISELDKLIRETWVMKPMQNQGRKAMGYVHWGYEGPAGPYHTYIIGFDSEDGKTVRNFTAKIIREN